MNYHILPDDKFIDGYIEEVEQVCAPNTNIYFVRCKPGDAKYVKCPLIRFINIDSAEFQNVLISFDETDRVFVHWYDLAIGKLLLSINNKIPVLAVLYGGDFYEEPFYYHLNWLCDPITKKYVKRTILYPKVWARRPHLLFTQLKSILKIYTKAIEDFNIKKKTIERINYILIDPNNVGEVAFAKKIYGIKNLRTLPFHYDLNFDFANSIRGERSIANKYVNILIGNSGTAMNNHADCLNVLKKYRDENIKILLPLSYGNKEYIKFVKQEAEKIFFQKTRPIEAFLARADYVHLLNSVDIAIMYHNRSQAFGNMITLLSLGKKLYLKKQNPLWKLFQKTGILVFDACKIKDISFKDFSTPLTSLEIEVNVEKVSKLFSDKKRLEYVEYIFNR
jgi:hypothetical protein